MHCMHSSENMGTTYMKLASGISAVITGGASGLGAACARRLAAQGVKVALFDLNEASGEDLAAELGGVFCKVDVTSESDVDAGFTRARAALGQRRGGAAATRKRRLSAPPGASRPLGASRHLGASRQGAAEGAQSAARR